MSKINVNGLKVDKILFDFVNSEVIPGLDIKSENFWTGFSQAVHELTPRNKKLINKRDEIQKKIDQWHLSNKDVKINENEYLKFLKSINYIVEEKEDFQIDTSKVDKEIAKIAGPQLVVPVDNARYALNAANARWGSLYDALYGTDVLSKNKSNEFDQDKANKVVNYVRDFLNKIFPISNGDWKEVSNITVGEENLSLIISGKKFSLKNKKQFVGFKGNKSNPNSILLINNNLHIDIIIDPNSPVGKKDKAKISDIIIESALSTIVDNEDSVAAVDSVDKIKCYRNWLGIMKGTLQAEFNKNGKKLIRKLNEDRKYTSINGSEIILHGRSLLLNRNVGHLMTNPGILLEDGSEIPEGILDAFISTLCAMHDIKNKKNSRTGSFYIVKPKMHGPEEVEFTNDLFERVEKFWV